MWQRKNVSVVLPTYNEKESIARDINDFFATGYVDEVVVVNNNAIAGTDEEVKATPARLVYESQQGYGTACRRPDGGQCRHQRSGANPDNTGNHHDIAAVDHVR